jgi:hypothetical protein
MVEIVLREPPGVCPNQILDRGGLKYGIFAYAGYTGLHRRHGYGGRNRNERIVRPDIFRYQAE